MRIVSIIIFLPVFLLSALQLSAQTNQYRFSRIDITQGLSNNEVNCIFKDERGFMWFGTRSGLNRFDGNTFKIFKHDFHDTASIKDEEIVKIFPGPGHTLWINTKSTPEVYDLLTEKFNHHPENILHAINIPDNSILDLKKDNKGNFWFLGSSTGLYKYDPHKKTTTHFDDEGSSSNQVTTTAFTISTNGDIWIVKSDGLIKKLDPFTGRAIFTSDALQNASSKEISSFAMYSDHQNDLWIYSSIIAEGIFYYNVSTGKILHIKKGNEKNNLNNEVIKGVIQDEDGLIWIATDHGGINMLNKKNFTINYLVNSEDDDHSITQNSIDGFYMDDNGIIWIGTFKKGICYYHRNIIKFPLYRSKSSDVSGLPYNDINRFAEDAKGNIWIGTNGGGLVYFDRESGKYTQYVHNPSNPNSLCNDVIVSLCIDKKQTLWIGTYFGGLDHFDGKTFTHYRHDDTNKTGISDNAIWSLMEDSSRRLWIGTFSAGLDILDLNTNKFTHYSPSSTTIIQSNYVCGFTQARNGDMWIATSVGVDVVKNGTGRVIHYLHDPANPSTSLSNDNTIDLMQDSRGLIWVATREGLNYFDQATRKFTTLYKQDGLPDNIILSLAEDKEHNMWVSTPSGLSNIIISKTLKTGKLVFGFRNYNESDGLQGTEFNEYAALATKDGELLFGGANGYNMFRPEQISNVVYAPKLVLTDLQMFNKSVNVGERLNGHVILPQSISETRSISLKYNENIFSIEFTALNFFNKSKLHYAYTLEGFNNEWFIADDKTHKATYTNLDPGSYTFKVRTIDEKGVWSKDLAVLKIDITPPFWRTPFAYVIYILVLIITLYLARRMVLKKARMRFAIEQERKEAHRLHELDMMKINFFTNLSHEFRTPLSLILTPIDKIIKTAAGAAQKHQLQMIQRNAKRLLNLVNQLLDFREMEMRELKLFPENGDIITFIKDVADAFVDLAEKKNIAFSFISSTPKFYTRFDPNKIERIILNLLSNAFKFTPENGTVKVELDTTKKDNITILEIKISDTGIGISKEKHEKIFERFFQSDVPESMVNQGSGIGLFITREFVKLHNGSINIKSEINKGSCFTISLPLKENTEAVEAMNVKDDGAAEQLLVSGAETVLTTNEFEKATVLIVEDNEDLRFYLKDNLKQYFTVAEAADGKAGWQKTLSVHPDIIVSDISMPHMSGIDLCKKIKNDKRTSLIPVILLTALTGKQEELHGLRTGASDYITKPFNFEILLSKIKNLLIHQQTVKQTYQKRVTANPSEIQTESAEQKFIQQALAVMEKNIANPDFSVEELSRELFMSRVALYKKLLAFTGKTPIEFIRFFRLQRAAQLLEKTNLTVAEIAYQVGFNNPKYFSRFFKLEFKLLPSVYQAGKKAATSSNIYDVESAEHASSDN